MNKSPEKNIEGAKTDIKCISLTPLTNTLKKGQENGDGTKVITSGEYVIERGDIPVIDSKSITYYIDSNAKRRLATGEVMKASNVTKERRELQKAIMAEQKKEKEQKESGQMEI